MDFLNSAVIVLFVVFIGMIFLIFLFGMRLKKIQEKILGLVEKTEFKKSNKKISELEEIVGKKKSDSQNTINNFNRF